jgi:hypothetical protein
LEQLFANAGLLPLLREAVMTNFLFFKSGSHTRNSDLRWMDLPKSVRTPLEEYSLEELRGLLTAMEPQQIMILGMGAFSKRASNQALGALANDGRRWLIGTGTLWGVPASGVMHPTGARWAAEDQERAAAWLRTRFSSAA